MAGVSASSLARSQALSTSSADQQEFQSAMAAFDQGDYAHAEQLFTELHTRHSDSYQINELLGLTYAAIGNVQSAVMYLKLAVQEQPEQPAIHANLGTAYLRIGRKEDAVHELSIAAKLEPGNAQTEEALGQAWMLLNNPSQARAAFAAALAADMKDPDLYYNSALACFASGDSSQAATLLGRMPGVGSSASAQSLYGDVEEKLGNYKEAGSHYAEAVNLEPSEVNIYLLGMDFLRHWTFDAAVKEFQAGVDKYPESNRMRFGLGAALYGDEKYDRAISIFSELLKNNPDDIHYAELLGRSCSALTEGEQPGCSELLAFVSTHRQAGLIATYAAGSLIRSASEPNLAAARQLLHSAIGHQPLLPEAHYEMGLLLQTEGQWEQSISELDVAIQNRHDFTQAHYRLALAYSHTGRKDQANSEAKLAQLLKKQESQNLDAKLNQITTLLVNMK